MHDNDGSRKGIGSMNVPPSCKFDDMIENGAEQTCFTGQKEGALFEKTQ